VSDPNLTHADPYLDPAFYANADPDPAYELNSDPDSGNTLTSFCSKTKKALPVLFGKIMSQLSMF
jgi:hypothetical protein